MAEDRQAEGRLGDEEIAAHRLEGHAGGIEAGALVARDDDALAGNLLTTGGGEDVAGRGEGELDPAELEPVAVIRGCRLPPASGPKRVRMISRVPGVASTWVLPGRA